MRIPWADEAFSRTMMMTGPNGTAYGILCDIFPDNSRNFYLLLQQKMDIFVDRTHP